MHSLYHIIGDIFTQRKNNLRIKCFIKSTIGKAPNCTKADDHLCHISHILFVTCFLTAVHIAQLKNVTYATILYNKFSFFSIFPYSSG